MIDAHGKELIIGQTVVIPCNSKLLKGTLISHRENTSRWFETCVERLHGPETFRGTWLTQEYIEEMRHIYRVLCEDGKRRNVYRKGICAYDG